MNKIQSKDHDIATYRISKIYLPCCDNKKHVLEDVLYVKMAYNHLI